MTPPELVNALDSATAPEDVFGAVDSSESLKKLYRSYALLIHPDTIDSKSTGITKDKATLAFQKLEVFSSFAEEKLTAGNYGDRSVLRKPIVVTTKKQVYTLTHTLPKTEIANVYSGTNKDGAKILLKVARNARDNDLIQNEAKTLKLCHTDPTTKDMATTLQLIPKVIDSFQNISGKEKQEVVVFEFGDGKSFSIKEVIEAYPKGIPLEHAAWMFNRLLGSLEAAHALGIAHGAIIPTNLIIHPATHKGILTNWDFAVKTGDKLKGIMGGNRYRVHYPSEVFNKKPIDLGLDLYMAAKLFISLIGGSVHSNLFPEEWALSSIAGDQPRDKQLEGYRKIQGLMAACLLVQGRRPTDVADLYTNFRAALELIFGPPKWRDFTMP